MGNVFINELQGRMCAFLSLVMGTFDKEEREPLKKTQTLHRLKSIDQPITHSPTCIGVCQLV